MSRSLTFVARAILFTAAAAGCKNRDEDRQRRFDWIHQQTATHNLYVREILSRPGSHEFGDGWYAPESDVKTGSAWRWMERRGILRLPTLMPGAEAPSDMEMKLFGWVPWEHVGVRFIQMEFAVNGHVLGRFDPPKGSFEHTVFVPRWLLEQSEMVDFVISVTNTARPPGDWRDLGFGTSGFHWTRAPGRN